MRVAAGNLRLANVLTFLSTLQLSQFHAIERLEPAIYAERVVVLGVEAAQIGQKLGKAASSSWKSFRTNGKQGR